MFFRQMKEVAFYKSIYMFMISMGSILNLIGIIYALTAYVSFYDQLDIQEAKAICGPNYARRLLDMSISEEETQKINDCLKDAMTWEEGEPTMRTPLQIENIFQFWIVFEIVTYFANLFAIVIALGFYSLYDLRHERPIAEEKKTNNNDQPSQDIGQSKGKKD